MTDQHKPHRRIVSKTRFVACLASRGAHRAVGWLMFTCALVFVLIVLVILTGVVREGMPPIHDAIIVVGFGLLCIREAILIGQRSLKHASLMEPLAPLTRRTAADLPEPESLVRASEEPVQAAGKVLLRAVRDTQEEPVEELLRPTVDSARLP